MWAFRVVHCGVGPDSNWTIGAGNDCMQMLHNKTRKGWRMETEQMRKLPGRIYVVPDFTQEMCEMNSIKLANYVMKVGACIS